MHTIVWTSVLFVCLAMPSHQLECFKCSDVKAANARETNDPCGDLPDKLVSQCRPNEDICYKFLLSGPDGSKLTTRGCSTGDFCYGLNQHSPSDDNGATAECHSCHQDKCNAASNVVISTPPILFFAMLLTR